MKCSTRIWSVLALLIATAGPAAPVWESRRLPDLPDPLGLAAPVAGHSGGALIVGGGANFPDGYPWEGGKKRWHRAACVLPDGAEAWLTGFKLPRALAYAVSLTTPRGVLVAGGSDAARHYADTFLLEWREGRLLATELPPLPRPLANACGAILDGRAYVAGGEEQPGATNATMAFYIMDLATAHRGWVPMPPWPGPARSLACAGAQAGRFLLFGGVSLAAGPDGAPVRTYLRDAYAYEPDAGWQRIADLPHPLAAAPSPAPATDLASCLLLGGDDGSRQGYQPVQDHPGFSGRILSYHAATDAWADAGELPVARVTVPAVPWAGGFVIPGGETRPGVRSPEVWWHRPPLPAAAP